VVPDVFDLHVLALKRTYERLPAGTLLQWITEGRIAPTDQVRSPGSSSWQAVRDVPMLMAAMPAGAAREPSLHMELDPEQAADAAAAWESYRPRRRHEDVELDMTPMIDVTFQLLIFFMLTNALANASPVDLPRAVHGEGMSPDGVQMILVDDQGRYYLGEKVDPQFERPLEQLVKQVERNASQLGGGMPVIISAHRQTKHAQVRQLVEALGTIGNLGKVRLGVEEAQ
jgi:biopolymer transport protein ExbD